MACDDLALLFPRAAVGALDAPGALAVQATPTALGLLLWLVLELARRRRPSAPIAVRAALGAGFAAAAALGVLSWRVFDLLECGDVEAAEDWRMLAVVGAPLVALALLALGTRAARSAVLGCLALAGGTVFVDWLVRERVLASAAQPLPAVQHLWCLLAVAGLARLPARSPYAGCERARGFSSARGAAPRPHRGIGLLGRKPARAGRGSVCLAAVDPLSRGRKAEWIDGPSDRHSSWFA